MVLPSPFFFFFFFVFGLFFISFFFYFNRNFFFFFYAYERPWCSHPLSYVSLVLVLASLLSHVFFNVGGVVLQ